MNNRNTGKREKFVNFKGMPKKNVKGNQRDRERLSFVKVKYLSLGTIDQMLLAVNSAIMPSNSALTTFSSFTK